LPRPLPIAALICCSTGTLLADPAPHAAPAATSRRRDITPSSPHLLNKMVASSKTCNVCGKAGHLARTCPSKGKSCDICGKVGHLRAVCPNANPVRSLLISAA